MNKGRTENRMNSGSVQNSGSGKHNVAKLGGTRYPRSIKAHGTRRCGPAVSAMRFGGRGQEVRDMRRKRSERKGRDEKKVRRDAG